MTDQRLVEWDITCKCIYKTNHIIRERVGVGITQYTAVRERNPHASFTIGLMENHLRLDATARAFVDELGDV